MSEKTYELKLPENSLWQLSLLRAYVTKAQARAIREQCEKIEKVPDEPPHVRISDIWKARGTGKYYLNITGKNPVGDAAFNWIGDPAAVWCNPRFHDHVCNVFDLLAQGPILVGLAEEEAAAIVNNWTVSTSAEESFYRKVQSALGTYRERGGRNES